MSFNKEKPRVAIIGSGIGGLTTALALKQQLRFENFLIYEKESDIGGTWRDNIYPGCSSDVAGHWYSLSSEPNPYWSSYYVEQPEILAYWERLVEKHRLRKYVVFNTAVARAVWEDDAQKYRLTLRDTKTGVEREEVVEALVSASGGFTEPRYPDDIPGIEEFEGPKFHSARWRKDVDLHEKTVGVIGNAASGVQLIPRIAQDYTTKVINFCRTPNWFAFGTKNYPYPAWVKWMFAYVPGVMRAYRLFLYFRYDIGFLIFRNENKRAQAAARKFLTQALKKHAPKELHDKLVPNYPPGCKRIIVEPGYLKSLHQPNVQLNWDGIAKFEKDGVVTKKGEKIPLDVVIFATGFHVVKLLCEVRGKGGITLQEHFDSQGGPTAYLGTTVPGFPNFFMILGPNIATGHASVIFSEESQINYITQLLSPILSPLSHSHNPKLQITSVTVRQSTTQTYNTWLQSRISSSVFSQCFSYYRAGEKGEGKNVAIWPGPVGLFWWKVRRVKWGDYEVEVKGGEKEKWRWEREVKILEWKRRVKVVLNLVMLVMVLMIGVSPGLRKSAVMLMTSYTAKVYNEALKIPFVSSLVARLRSFGLTG